MGLAALFGAYQYFQTTDKFARTILCGQVIAIILTFIPTGYFPLDRHILLMLSLTLFMLTLVLTVVYGVRKRDFTTTKRLVIIVPTVFLFVRHLFSIQHYPYVGLVSLLMTIPIIIYLLAMLTDFKNYKNEFGFLTVIAVDAAIKLCSYFF